MKFLILTFITILTVIVLVNTNTSFAQVSENKFRVGVVSENDTYYQNGTLIETQNLLGNVGTVQTGQALILKVFKNNLMYKTDLIPAGEITSGEFQYQITIAFNFHDLYKIDYTYGNQTAEQMLSSAHTGIPPPLPTQPQPASPLK